MQQISAFVSEIQAETPSDKHKDRTVQGVLRLRFLCIQHLVRTPVKCYTYGTADAELENRTKPVGCENLLPRPLVRSSGSSLASVIC